MPLDIRAAAAPELDAPTLYRILRLRSQVFVVEQECAFLDLDGRDLEPTTTHLWIDDDPEAPTVRACARLLAEPEGATSIGRIVTHPSSRGQGLGALLVGHALTLAGGPFTMKAQARLSGYYARFGFERAGPDFVEDGIPHTPMKRA